MSLRVLASTVPGYQVGYVDQYSYGYSKFIFSVLAGIVKKFIFVGFFVVQWKGCRVRYGGLLLSELAIIRF